MCTGCVHEACEAITDTERLKDHVACSLPCTHAAPECLVLEYDVDVPWQCSGALVFVRVVCGWASGT